MLKSLTQTLVYFTAALIAATLAIGIFIGFKRKDKLPVFFNCTLGLAAGYSISTGFTLMYLTFREMKDEGSFYPELFYPLLGLLILVAVLTLAAYLLSLYKKEWLKYFMPSALVVTGIYIILLVSLNSLKAYMYETFTVTENVMLGIFAVILFAVLIVVPLIFGKKTKAENHTKSVVYAALAVALSFALSYLRLFKLPQGGSITFASLLPLILYSYMFGTRKGVLAGFIYGMLQAIQDPWILHPVQFLLDYPLAFGMIGLAGLFKELKLFKNNSLIQFIVGTIAACTLRYACHVISGIIVFKIYAPIDPVAWGFLYNAFVFADAAIVVVAGAVMFGSKSFKELVNAQVQ